MQTVVEAPTIKVERTKMSSVDWDGFALRCDASCRGLHGWIRLWPIRSHIFSHTVYYSIFHQHAGGRTKIGQCAVHIQRDHKAFADGLQLLPEYQNAWPSCMRAILSELGPGRYVYGSYWSLEPPRESELSTLAGVTVTDVEKYMVEAVDFARWGSWEDYARGICLNVRRNMQKARAKYGHVQIEIKRGPRALGHSHHLLYTRARMLKRKAAPMRFWGMFTNYVLRALFIPEHAYSAILRADGRTLATFGGAEVGRHAYYFDGGTTDGDGTGWLLKMALMEDFYRRHPTGRFLMGSEPWNGEARPDTWESAARYRRDARVSGFPTSVVTFAFSG